MAFREVAARQPMLSVFMAVIFAGVVGFMTWSMVKARPTADDKSYYTTDDGQTFFADSLARVPPFDHGGKLADRAVVFSCDGGKTRFVGYLERYTDAAKATLASTAAAFKSGRSKIPPVSTPSDIEIKKPGAGNRWISGADPGADKITRVKCPNGAAASVILP